MNKVLVIEIDIIGAFVLRDVPLAFILTILYTLFEARLEALQMGQPPAVSPAR